MGDLVGILSILNLWECGMCCHQSKQGTIRWSYSANAEENSPDSHSGNPSFCRSCGSVKDVACCKNLFKKANEEVHALSPLAPGRVKMRDP